MQWSRRSYTWSGVLAGMAAAVVGGLLYHHAMASATVTANCVDDTNQHVVNEQYCGQDYADSHSDAGGRYLYYFGGSVHDGTVSGGSYRPPDLGTLRTADGTVLQRGGFGVPDLSGSDSSNGDQVGSGGGGTGADEGGDVGGDDTGGDVGGGDIGGGEGGGDG